MKKMTPQASQLDSARLASDQQFQNFLVTDVENPPVAFNLFGRSDGFARIVRQLYRRPAIRADRFADQRKRRQRVASDQTAEIVGQQRAPAE